MPRTSFGVEEVNNMNSGIYKIANSINGKFYIGSSVNIKQRWIHHRCKLNTGKHVNNILLNAWKKYGKDSFIFSVVEYCNENKLLEREQYYLDGMRPAYNISKVAGKPPKIEYIKICKQCNKQYISHQSRSIFCSNSCKSKWRRDSNIDNEIRVCAICGNRYKINKYRKSITCSNSCGSKLLWKNISQKSRDLHKKNVSKSKKYYYSNGGTSSVSKPIAQFSIDGKSVQRFKSVKAAADKMNVDLSGIARCARGKQKTACGYIWQYI